MYIDDFIWLPDILDKLAVKHRVSQAEVEESFSIIHDIVSLKKGTGHAKMSTQPVVRLMQADISSCSSFGNRTTRR